MANFERHRQSVEHPWCALHVTEPSLALSKESPCLLKMPIKLLMLHVLSQENTNSYTLSNFLRATRQIYCLKQNRTMYQGNFVMCNIVTQIEHHSNSEEFRAQ